MRLDVSPLLRPQTPGQLNSVLVQPAPPEHYVWLGEHAGCGITQDFRAVEAVKAGRILGMVGYCDWAPNSARLHVAVESPWVIKYLLGPGFSYPFREVGVGLLIGITPANALKAVKFNRHLGFREAQRIKDGWGTGVDLIVFEMRRDECKWLNPKSLPVENSNGKYFQCGTLNIIEQQKNKKGQNNANTRNRSSLERRRVSGRTDR